MSIAAILKSFANEAIELGGNTLETFDRQPTSLEFASLVGKNRPAVFKKAFLDTLPINKWTNAYITEKMKNHTVTVSLTPNGLADSIFGDKFVMPFEKKMDIPTLLSNIGIQCTGPVHYIQSQNDNLNAEWIPLMKDLPENFDFAVDTLGKPDAFNIWLGDSRSNTSLHKDHYENIYVVVSGTKTFTLYPPTDYCLLNVQTYPLSQWQLDETNEIWSFIDIPGSTPWLDIPNPSILHPIHITLEPGDGLYLPSLWFHQVSQKEPEDSNCCIAVNYWYDMDYADARYSYFQLIHALHEHQNKQKE